ncbi:gene transfer agent family protein [uncultured Cohaesibacter sp.]|uniref:gene transfer agent family protein n=1 Tax=uncultured Cohaesibacter sp. TaxID=1002546 RepID=UPI00292E5908|nr:gene transfer agent family protein [uncultured Cohaesibacter sp.]
MANKRRGEVSLRLNDQNYRLCLTLAALAELEDSMELDNIGALADRFASGKVKSSDLVKILGAALRAGGAEVTDREAASMHCEGGAVALASALVELLQQTFNPNALGEMANQSKGGAEGTINPS